MVTALLKVEASEIRHGGTHYLPLGEACLEGTHLAMGGWERSVELKTSQAIILLMGKIMLVFSKSLQICG